MSQIIKCHRCKNTFPNTDMIGANLFYSDTGMHIITNRYCRFCAGVLFGIDLK